MICSILEANLETKKHTTYYRNLGVSTASWTWSRILLYPSQHKRKILEYKGKVCDSDPNPCPHSDQDTSVDQMYESRSFDFVVWFSVFCPSSDHWFNMLHHLSAQQRVVCIVMCAKMSCRRPQAKENYIFLFWKLSFEVPFSCTLTLSNHSQPESSTLRLNKLHCRSCYD